MFYHIKIHVQVCFLSCVMWSVLKLLKIIIIINPGNSEVLSGFTVVHCLCHWYFTGPATLHLLTNALLTKLQKLLPWSWVWVQHNNIQMVMQVHNCLLSLINNKIEDRKFHLISLFNSLTFWWEVRMPCPCTLIFLWISPPQYKTSSATNGWQCKCFTSYTSYNTTLFTPVDNLKQVGVGNV